MLDAPFSDYAHRGFPTRRPASECAGTRRASAVDLDVAVTRVAPGERSAFERKRLDHLMATRASVRGVVSLLGLAATNVPALRTQAQVERTATFFAVLRARLADLLRAVSTFGLGAGKELHVVVCVSVFSQVSEQRWAGDRNEAHNCRHGARMRVSGLKTAQANQK